MFWPGIDSGSEFTGTVHLLPYSHACGLKFLPAKLENCGQFPKIIVYKHYMSIED